jgi:hypothetical protein
VSDDLYCPRCGVAYEPTQEYCLECGARLPVNHGVVGVLAGAWQRRFARYPGDWIWPVLAMAALAIASTAVALSANSARKAQTPYVATTPSVPVGPGAPRGSVPVTTGQATLPIPTNQPTITTGPLPQPPGTRTGRTVTTPPATNPNALAAWPADKSGYTVVLESLPLSVGRANANARARQAKSRGLRDVGVLVSAQFSSFHPGYFVVFSGIYGSQGEASAAATAAHSRGYAGAYPKPVTR